MKDNGKKHEYIDSLLDTSREPLVGFSEFKKIMCRDKPCLTLIFKECEFNRFAHLVTEVVKRDYDIVVKDNEVKFIPKK